MDEFYRIKRLPPYVFAAVNEMKYRARVRGEDIIDFGMGNPDGATPQPIVDKLVAAAQDPRNHRYSQSKGIRGLRKAMAGWYQRRFNVELDPETEVVVTLGSKEGLSHLLMAVIGPGEAVLVPNPTYPIHAYGVVLAGGDVINVFHKEEVDFFAELKSAYLRTWPRPRLLILNFPHNPTTATVEAGFFEQVVAFARENDLLVIHDLAYADIAFDGYSPPSFLAAPHARDVGVECFTLSKSYNMPGWRVGFVCGNARMVHALSRLKSYLDYGMFQPIQIASTVALNEMDEEPPKISRLYQERRDVLIDGLRRIGWTVPPPKATMFVWAKIPEPFRAMGSLEFSKMLVEKAKVAVAPGVGFGMAGDEYVRFALVENEQRVRQAVRGLKTALGG